MMRGEEGGRKGKGEGERGERKRKGEKERGRGRKRGEGEGEKGTKKVEVPLLGDVKEEDDTVGSLVHVHKLRVQTRLVIPLSGLITFNCF